MPRSKSKLLVGKELTTLANQVEELRLLRELERAVRDVRTHRVIEEALKALDKFRREIHQRALITVQDEELS